MEQKESKVALETNKDQRKKSRIVKITHEFRGPLRLQDVISKMVTNHVMEKRQDS